MLRMNEDFLHFVWEHKLFNTTDLHTTSGVPITIRKLGVHNFSSGPDFMNARIELDQTLWAGNVEIHLKSSDWLHHNHQHDDAFDNVILHVVFEHDKEIYNRHNEKLPTLELKGLIPGNILANYQTLKGRQDSIPCSEVIGDIDKIYINTWLNRVLIERQERKSAEVELLFDQCGGDWKQTYYTLLAAYLGQNTNKLPMMSLAQKVPFNKLSKHADRPDQLQALLLGASGFLESAENAWLTSLNQEFEFLEKKYAFSRVSQKWKTGRVRPENSPSRRVAQLASMIPSIGEAYEALLTGRNFDWSKVKLYTPEFWTSHYSVKSKSNKRLKFDLSPSIADIITINVHVPFLFFYGKTTGEEGLCDKAIDLLGDLAPEQNRIVAKWVKLLGKLSDAGQSQAVIELQNNYCNHKNCVLCNIGRKIISKP